MNTTHCPLETCSRTHIYTARGLPATGWGHSWTKGIFRQIIIGKITRLCNRQCFSISWWVDRQKLGTFVRIITWLHPTQNALSNSNLHVGLSLGCVSRRWPIESVGDSTSAKSAPIHIDRGQCPTSCPGCVQELLSWGRRGRFVAMD